MLTGSNSTGDLYHSTVGVIVSEDTSDPLLAFAVTELLVPSPDVSSFDRAARIRERDTHKASYGYS